MTHMAFNYIIAGTKRPGIWYGIQVVRMWTRAMELVAEMNALNNTHSFIDENIRGAMVPGVEKALSILESEWQNRHDRLVSVLQKYGMSDDEAFEFVTEHADANEW